MPNRAKQIFLILLPIFLFFTTRQIYLNSPRRTCLSLLQALQTRDKQALAQLTTSQGQMALKAFHWQCGKQDEIWLNNWQAWAQRSAVDATARGSFEDAVTWSWSAKPDCGSGRVRIRFIKTSKGWKLYDADHSIL
jgi:hypothetical protein